MVLIATVSMSKRKSEEMTEEKWNAIRRINASIGTAYLDIEMNEDVNIEELEKFYGLEFATDFKNVLQNVKQFKDKWHKIYREKM